MIVSGCSGRPSGWQNRLARPSTTIQMSSFLKVAPSRSIRSRTAPASSDRRIPVVAASTHMAASRSATATSSHLASCSGLQVVPVLARRRLTRQIRVLGRIDGQVTPGRSVVKARMQQAMDVLHGPRCEAGRGNCRTRPRRYRATALRAAHCHRGRPPPSRMARCRRWLAQRGPDTLGARITGAVVADRTQNVYSPQCAVLNAPSDLD